MGNNIEKRIERLEDYVPEGPDTDKYIALLMELDGFKEKHGLRDNCSAEEVQEVLNRLRNKRRLYD